MWSERVNKAVFDRKSFEENMGPQPAWHTEDELREKYPEASELLQNLGAREMLEGIRQEIWRADTYIEPYATKGYIFNPWLKSFEEGISEKFDHLVGYRMNGTRWDDEFAHFGKPRRWVDVKYSEHLGVYAVKFVDKSAYEIFTWSYQHRDGDGFVSERMKPLESPERSTLDAALFEDTVNRVAIGQLPGGIKRWS